MITINRKNIHVIKDLAQTSFHTRPTWEGYSGKEIQIACIVDAIHRFVISKGYDPGFTLEDFIQEDCDTLDGGWNSGDS